MCSKQHTIHSMNHIKLLAQIDFKDKQKLGKTKDINVLLNEKQKVMEIKLFNGEILAKHKANSPISVLCLKGNGTFKAGENLEEEQKLTQGTLIYLEKDIPHEIIGELDLSILVTKFSA